MDGFEFIPTNGESKKYSTTCGDVLSIIQEAPPRTLYIELRAETATSVTLVSPIAIRREKAAGVYCKSTYPSKNVRIENNDDGEVAFVIESSDGEVDGWGVRWTHSFGMDFRVLKEAEKKKTKIIVAIYK